LAMQAGAVSRWTSYLAEEKGAQPSTDGWEDGVGIGCSAGCGGCSFSCGTHCGGGIGVGIDESVYIAILPARMEPAVAEVARPAGRPRMTVRLGVERPLQEIVDAGATGKALWPPLQACVEDAIWAAQLDRRFHWSERTFEFEVTTGDGDDAPPEPVDQKEWM